MPCKDPEKRKAYQKAHQKIWSQRVRLEVLTHYSGGTPQCACCEESRLEFLCIDHIDGGGAKHRKAIKTVGVGFYYWLRRNNYPSGYRVLCHNCNMSRGIYGYCPHEREDNIEV